MAQTQVLTELPKAEALNTDRTGSQEADTVLRYLKYYDIANQDTQNVQQALKAYQEQAELEQTGKYDKDTAAKLSKPACGLGHEILQNFEAAPTKWDRLDLTYCFNNYCEELSRSDCRRVISEALEKWSAVSPLTFREVLAPRNADIRIGWYRREHVNDNEPFDGRGSFGANGTFSNVLAHAFFPPPNAGEFSGDVHFDEDEVWTVPLLENVALHEIGHSLGLRHSQLPTAVMYFQSNGVTDLQPDDIAGIQSIYPQNPAAAENEAAQK